MFAGLMGRIMRADHEGSAQKEKCGFRPGWPVAIPELLVGREGDSKIIADANGRTGGKGMGEPETKTSAGMSE